MSSSAATMISHSLHSWGFFPALSTARISLRRGRNTRWMRRERCGIRVKVTRICICRGGGGRVGWLGLIAPKTLIIRVQFMMLHLLSNPMGFHMDLQVSLSSRICVFACCIVFTFRSSYGISYYVWCLIFYILQLFCFHLLCKEDSELLHFVLSIFFPELDSGSLLLLSSFWGHLFFDIWWFDVCLCTTCYSKLIKSIGLWFCTFYYYFSLDWMNSKLLVVITGGGIVHKNSFEEEELGSFICSYLDWLFELGLGCS